MFKYIKISFIAFSTLISLPLHAIMRKDVLECHVADGSQFMLTSTYDWFAVPLPLRGNTRESQRSSWVPLYIDVHGVHTAVPAGVMYSNKELQTLEEVCAHFGLHNGVAIAPYTYLRKNGTWYPKDNLPWKQLSAEIAGPSANAEKAELLSAAGIRSTPDMFGFIRPQDAQLIFEKPLSRKIGMLYTIPFDAVYQAFSNDNGRTWTEGRVTSDAVIFEMGRSWSAQSFTARPLRLNGKPLRQP